MERLKKRADFLRAAQRHPPGHAVFDTGNLHGAG